MTTTETIPGLERAHLNVAIPKPRRVPEGMPRLPLLQLIQGASGTGKTTALIDELLKYEKTGSIDFLYFISPTYHTDAKYSLLDEGEKSWKLEVLDEFSDEALARIIETVKSRHAEYKKYQEYRDVYKKFMRLRNPDKMTADEIVMLDANAFEPPRPPDGCKPDQVPQSMIVLDDLANDERLYKANSRGTLGKFLILARHFDCSLVFLLQVFRGGLNKQLRNNLSSVLLFRNRSASMRTAMAEEFSNTVDADTFLSLWDTACADLHDFLFIDARDPARMFRRNFNQVLSYPGQPADASK